MDKFPPDSETINFVDALQHYILSMGMHRTREAHCYSHYYSYSTLWSTHTISFILSDEANVDIVTKSDDGAVDIENNIKTLPEAKKIIDLFIFNMRLETHG